MTVELPRPSPKIARALADGAELPLLDVGDFLAGKPGAMEQLAADIRAVHENLGFMAIVDHGVDQSIIDEAVEQARKVFSLPPEELEKYRHVNHMQGYWPPNSVRNVRPGFEGEKEHLATASGWAFLRDREPDDPKVIKNLRHRAMNKWPDPKLFPGFRPAVQRYHHAMLALAMKLLKPYSLALGQAPNFLDKDFADAEWYGRLNYYTGNPDNVANPENREKVLPLTAHTDHSFITLLPMTPVPGLQVRSPRQEWIDVGYVPGAIIINGGEWLNQLSNGRFLATPHRVVTLPCERISMPLFFDPGDEALNDPVPGSVGRGEARKFPRETWGKFFVAFIDGYTVK
jgi:isopenicillin N synthase-like dioxygenase